MATRTAPAASRSTAVRSRSSTAAPVRSSSTRSRATRRSSHGNAYFTGFGNSKRIVFFDTLLARLLPPTRDDDVAMVAVRLHRQDEPRPPEAGPNDV